MKITIIKKILNPKFEHSWKSIFVRQLKFLGQIEISVDNALTCEKSVIVKNILTTFVQWKNKIVNVKGTCSNHVVWANKSITEIGSQLWNENLIYRGILYIKDFLNGDSTIMNYNQFCVNWDLDVSEITSRDYVDIKMAIRSFNCSTKIDNEACLTFFRYNWSEKNNLSGKILREKCTCLSPRTLCHQ